MKAILRDCPDARNLFDIIPTAYWTLVQSERAEICGFEAPASTGGAQGITVVVRIGFDDNRAPQFPRAIEDGIDRYWCGRPRSRRSATRRIRGMDPCWTKVQLAGPDADA